MGVGRRPSPPRRRCSSPAPGSGTRPGTALPVGHSQMPDGAARRVEAQRSRTPLGRTIITATACPSPRSDHQPAGDRDRAAAEDGQISLTWQWNNWCHPAVHGGFPSLLHLDPPGRAVTHSRHGPPRTAWTRTSLLRSNSCARSAEARRQCSRQAGADPVLGGRDDYQDDAEAGPVTATGPASVFKVERDAGPHVPRGTGVPLRQTTSVGTGPSGWS